MLQEEGYNTSALVLPQLRPSLGFDRGYDGYDVVPYNEDIDSREEWEERIISKFDEVEEPWFYFIHLPEVHYPRHIDPSLNNDEFGENMYERAISTSDKLIHKVLKKVDFDNTVVIYTSDHGESITNKWIESIFDFPRPLSWLTRLRYGWGLDKQLEWVERRLNFLRKLGVHEHDRFTTVDHGFYPYECLVRIPFAMAGGPIEEKGRIDHQVRQIDIAPTILELAEATDHPDMEGEALQSIIAGKTEQRDAYIMANGPVHWNNEPFGAIRTPSWKYVRTGDSQEALYNLSDDPVELHNVIEDNPDIASRMIQSYNRITDVGDLSESEDLSLEESETLNSALEDLGYL